MERAELPSVLFNLVYNSIINVTFLSKVWTVCSAHFAACKSRKTGKWLSWLNSTNFSLRNAIKNYKYMQCYREVTWHINVRIFLLFCYHEEINAPTELNWTRCFHNLSSKQNYHLRSFGFVEKKAMYFLIKIEEHHRYYKFSLSPSNLRIYQSFIAYIGCERKEENRPKLELQENIFLK